MKRILILALLLATASVSPLIFPIAESGRSSMNVLAEVALLPAAVILLVTVGLLHRAHHSLAGISTLGLAAGAVATIALEAIRLPGFWLGYMPGNLRNPASLPTIDHNRLSSICVHQASQKHAT